MESLTEQACSVLILPQVAVTVIQVRTCRDEHLQVVLLLLDLRYQGNFFSFCTFQTMAMPSRQAMPVNLFLLAGNDLHGN